MTLEIGIHDGIPAEDYHADALTPEPALSRSGIVTLINGGTLAEFAAQSPRLTQWPALIRDATDATDLGEIVHRMVLGVGCGFEVRDASDFANADGSPSKTWGSKEAAAFKADCDARGIPIIGREKHAMATMIAAKLSVVLQERFGAEWDARKCEQTVISRRRLNDGSHVWCRIRIDALLPSFIVDVKTTAFSLSDPALGKEIALKGLDVQHVFYQDVLTSATGLSLPFVFAYVRTVPPYGVRLVDLDRLATPWPIAMTRAEVDLAVHRFGAALQRNEWPDDPVDAQPVAPEWWKSQKAWKLMEAGLLEDAE